MEAYILEWLQLLFRSLHVITGIAWIGASFYFVWLDNHLRKPSSPDLINKGVDGELWAVHGGGFYNPQKYMVAPPQLPHNLHWFYWESYSTWISGVALFAVVYLWNAKTMMIDPSVQALTAGEAVGLALGIISVGWLIYDGICRVFSKREQTAAWLIAIMIAGIAYATCHIFSGRAAFMVTGATIATIMTANVYHVIIPGQRKVIAQMRSGEPVNPLFGQRGKQRSVHNTYFTLPVLFTMLSNHFSLMTSHPKRWVILILMMLTAVLVRLFFVQRHHGKNNWIVLVSALGILGSVMVWLAPSRRVAADVISEQKVTLQDVVVIFERRCAQCHSDHPTLVPEPAKNLSFTEPKVIEANAASIYMQVVQQRLMPLGNVTQMTEQERVMVKSWIESR